MKATLERSENVIWEQLGDEALAVRAESGQRWSLNAAATALWKLCDGSRNCSELARVLGWELRETAAFCRALLRAGLLKSAARMQPIPIVSCRSALTSGPAVRALGLTAGSRRRPTPRGNSGPG